MDTTLRDSDPENHRRPHLILLVPRGEAVRNFLYSDTLPLLSENARVTLLSVIHDAHFRERFEPHVDAILPLKHYPASQATNYIHMLVHEAHFDWLGSQVAENRWEVRLHGARTPMGRVKVRLERAFLGLFANRQIIEALVKLERRLHLLSPGADAFHKLFSELKPDLVFNTSHIHGQEAHLPVKVAHDMGIPTVGFIFSWDNLTSRSRIFEPYDYYLVWHQKMRDQLVSIYPNIQPENVLVTGTPQFDFHFKPEYWLAREALCQRIGVDPSRPFVLYTAGIDRHFPEEHRTVELIIRLLREMDVTPKPQLVVRTYIKGISPEMGALSERNLPDVVFPPMLWDPEWLMPHEDDLTLYTNLLRHASLGINAASTVSLELLMHDKPVINLDFDPPGSNLPSALGYHRHIIFDHYHPVAESGAVMVARSPDDMRATLQRGLSMPEADSSVRRQFIQDLFDQRLDGCAGQRVAEGLLDLATRASTHKAESV